MDLTRGTILTIDVPEGHIPTITTYFEMTDRPVVKRQDGPLKLAKWNAPEPAEYLSLFRAVGNRWMWTSRLLMDEDALRNILHHDAVEVYLIEKDDRQIGLLELDFREPKQCEIGFFGIIPDMNGQGYGRWLMAEALNRAWRPEISRVWLHTCTEDSPRAIPFYMSSGFTPYKREIEINPDPRLTGQLPMDAGPHIPIIPLNNS